MLIPEGRRAGASYPRAVVEVSKVSGFLTIISRSYKHTICFVPQRARAREIVGKPLTSLTPKRQRAGPRTLALLLHRDRLLKRTLQDIELFLV
jgi:hypothetical protein